MNGLWELEPEGRRLGGKQLVFNTRLKVRAAVSGAETLGSQFFIFRFSLLLEMHAESENRLDGFFYSESNFRASVGRVLEAPWITGPSSQE